MEEEPSLKGLDKDRESSSDISLGPNEVAARGDVMAGRLVVGTLRIPGLFDPDEEPGALTTSALTTPRTCLTAPLFDVMMTGASFRKSLE